MIEKANAGCLPANDWYVEWWDANKDQYWYEPVIGFGYSDSFMETCEDFRHYMTAVAMSLDGQSYVVNCRSKDPNLKDGTMQCLHVFKSMMPIILYKFLNPEHSFDLPRE